MQKTSLYCLQAWYFKKTFKIVLDQTRRGRFAGFSLYVSNTTKKDDGFVCYQNESKIPDLDFNTSCITHGQYVIFYNERVVGKNYSLDYQTANVITELCEVTVNGMDIFFLSLILSTLLAILHLIMQKRYISLETNVPF